MIQQVLVGPRVLGFLQLLLPPEQIKIRVDESWDLGSARPDLNVGPTTCHVVLEKSHNFCEPPILYGNNNTSFIDYGRTK